MKKTLLKYRKEKRLKIFLKLFASFLTYLIIAFTFLLIIEYFYEFNPYYRTLNIIGISSLSLFYSIYCYKKYLKITAPFSKELRTSAIEYEKENTTTTLLQLHDLIKLKDDKKDSSLIDKAIFDYKIKFDKEIVKPVLNKKIGFNFFKKTILIFVIPTLLIFFNNDFKNSAYKILHFRTIFKKPTILKNIILNSQIIEQENITLKCKISGTIPSKIFLYMKKMDENKWSNNIIYTNKSDSLYSFLKENVSHDFSYFFKSEKAISDTNNITILKYPEIKRFSIEIKPPSYTKMKTETINDVIADISVLKGSDVVFYIEPLAKLDSVKMVIIRKNSDKIIKLIKNKDKKYYYKQNVKYPLNFYFKLYSASLTNKNPLEYKIIPYFDEYPIVNILSPGDGTFMDNKRTIPLITASFDDYAIRKVEIYYKRINSFMNKSKKQDFHKKRLKINKSDEGAYITSDLFTFEDMLILPKDKIELFARAYDNDIVSGPKFTDSKHITVTLPSLEEMFEKSEKKYKKQAGSFDKQLFKNKNLKEEIKKLTNKLKAGDKLSWEMKKNINSAIEEQKKMITNLKNTEKSIKENIKNLNENSLLSKETMSKYMKLDKMINELFSKEMKSQLEKMSNLSKKENPSKKDMNEMLKNFSEQQKKFEKGLEKAIKILQQIELEYKLDKLIKKFNDLSKRQEQINLSLDEKNLPQNEIKDKESQIEKDYKKTLKDIENIKKNYESSFSSDLKQDLKDIIAFNKDANLDDNFSKLNKNANSNRKKASNQAEKIKDNFDENTDLISDFKDKYLEKQKEELEDEIRKVMTKLLKFSFEVENIKNAGKNITKKSSKGKSIVIHSNQLKLYFQKISKAIFEIAQKTFFIDNKTGSLIGIINNTFRTIDPFIESRNFSFVSRYQNDIIKNTNRLILVLNKSINDLKASSSPSGLQEMLKKMEEMAKKQKDINKGSQSMMQMPAMGSGSGSSSGKSSKAGESPFQQSMAQLAKQQAALYEALQKMMSDMGLNQDGSPSKSGKGEKPGENGQPGKSGKNGKSGEDGSSGKNGKNGKNGSVSSGKGSALGKKLSGLGGSMKDLLNEMKDKEVSNSMLKKQKVVLKKMLDAVNSMKREKFSKKRESKYSDLKSLNPGNKNLFSDPELNLKDKMLKSLKDGYNKSYRIKIKKYFDNLNK